MRRSRNAGKLPNRSKPQTQSSKPVTSPESFSSTTAIESRRSAIEETRKEEKAALTSYEKALEDVQRCDPLTVGYSECQARLRKASEALISAREAHQRAMAGMQPKPDAP